MYIEGRHSFSNRMSYLINIITSHFEPKYSLFIDKCGLYRGQWSAERDVKFVFNGAVTLEITVKLCQ